MGKIAPALKSLNIFNENQLVVKTNAFVAKLKSDLSKRQTTMKLTSKHANLRVVVVHVKGDTPQLEQSDVGQCQLSIISIVLPFLYFDN